MIEEERELKAKAAGKMLKFLIPAWIGNFLVFTSTLFMGNYADHIGHWTQVPFMSMCVGSGITKLVLSILLLVNYSAYSGQDT